MSGTDNFKAALRRHRDRRRSMTLRQRLPRLTPAQLYKLIALAIAAIAALFLESSTILSLLDVFLK